MVNRQVFRAEAETATLTFAAHAAVLKTDPAKSYVSATFKQMKVAKGSMELTNVGVNFRDVLQNTGLAGVFTVV